MQLDLIGRSGCGLCDEGRATLVALGASFEEFDVDDDPLLHALYTDRVPVLLRDGEVIAEGRLKPALVARVLAS